jgi:hypothetical protein
MKNFIFLKGETKMENNFFKKLRWEEKRRKFKENFRSKAQEAYEWFLENKDTIVFLTPMVVGGITTIAKVVGNR